MRLRVQPRVDQHLLVSRGERCPFNGSIVSESTLDDKVGTPCTLLRWRVSSVTRRRTVCYVSITLSQLQRLPTIPFRAVSFVLVAAAAAVAAARSLTTATKSTSAQSPPRPDFSTVQVPLIPPGLINLEAFRCNEGRIVDRFGVRACVCREFSIKVPRRRIYRKLLESRRFLLHLSERRIVHVSRPCFV